MQMFLLLESVLVTWLLLCNNLGPLVLKKHLFGNHNSNYLLIQYWYIGPFCRQRNSGLSPDLVTKVSCRVYLGQTQQLAH